MESERRSYGLGSPLPNLDYSTSYSGSLSDVTPASHHALSNAYDDLKKRYNDLQGKYTQTAKQLRESQRRESSPELNNLASPRHMTSSLTSSSRSPRRTVDIENGEINQSDWNLMQKERDLLERQVSELEHKLSESSNLQAECEHESKQLREHVSRQEEDLRHHQQLQLRSENENEEIRKQIALLKRQFRESDSDRERDRDRERVRELRSLSPAAGAASQSQGSLGSSLDCSSNPQVGRVSMSNIGSLEQDDLNSVLQTTSSVTGQFRDLMSTIQKQRDVIKMLFKRMHDDRDKYQRQLEAQRRTSETMTCGVGARPKVRAPGGITSHGGAMSNPILPTLGHEVDAVPCSEDVNRINNKYKPPVRQRDPKRVSMTSSMESREFTGSPERAACVPERHSAPAAVTPFGQDPNTGKHPLPPSGPPPLTAPAVGHELESHYDDLQIGGGVGVSWEMKQEDDKSETEALLPSPRRLGRNESMEHLHDDSPPYDSLGDLGDSTSGSGSTLCGTDQESEYDELVPTSEVAIGYTELSNLDLPDTNNVPASPRTRLHPINNQRPEPLPPPLNPAQNRTDLNQRMWAQNGSTLDNNPQSSTAPVPGTGTHFLAARPRIPVERGSEDEDTRNCPVCSDDFPSHMAMEEFQKHVLECPGRPERICPMCDTTFPDDVSQTEFERHVNDHFDADDLTIQNFEVLQS